MKHVMIVGAHCGDGEIQAGAIAHKYAQAGYRVTFLHLTAGEKGAPPHMDVEEYRSAERSERLKRQRPFWAGRASHSRTGTPS